MKQIFKWLTPFSILGLLAIGSIQVVNNKNGGINVIEAAVGDLVAGGDTSTKDKTPADIITTNADGYYGSSRGIKFGGDGDYIETASLKAKNLKDIKVEFKAGYNGNTGSTLSFQPYGLDSKNAHVALGDPWVFTPTDKYTEQTTLNTHTFHTLEVIDKFKITFDKNPSNCAMKWIAFYEAAPDAGAFEFNVTTTNTDVLTGVGEVDTSVTIKPTNVQGDVTYTLKTAPDANIAKVEIGTKNSTNHSSVISVTGVSIGTTSATINVKDSAQADKAKDVTIQISVSNRFELIKENNLNTLKYGTDVTLLKKSDAKTIGKVPSTGAFNSIAASLAVGKADVLYSTNETGVFNLLAGSLKDTYSFRLDTKYLSLSSNATLALADAKDDTTNWKISFKSNGALVLQNVLDYEQTTPKNIVNFHDNKFKSYSETSDIYLYANKGTGVDLSSVEVVKDTNFNSSYVSNELFNPAGLKVMANFGSEKVDMTAWVSFPTNLEANQTEVTTTLTFLSHTSEVKVTGITVAQVEITGLTIESAPTKTTYMVSEAFEIAGLTVKATYSGGATEDVTSLVTLSINNKPLKDGDIFDKEGTFTVKVLYVNGEAQKDSSFTLTVTPYVGPITLEYGHFDFSNLKDITEAEIKNTFTDFMGLDAKLKALTKAGEMYADGSANDKCLRLNKSKGTNAALTLTFDRPIREVTIKYAPWGDANATLTVDTISKDHGEADENKIFIETFVLAEPKASFTIKANLRFKLYNISFLGEIAKTEQLVTDLNGFDEAYMHLNDYTEELGYCSDVDHHYYKDAKEAFTTLLSSEAQSIYTNSPSYSKGYQRLLAWAKANHEEMKKVDAVKETKAPISYSFVALNGTSNALSIDGFEDNTIILVSSICVITLLSVACILIITKKRHSKLD